MRVCRRLDSCLVNLVNNLVDRMRSRGRASSYDDEEDELNELEYV